MQQITKDLLHWYDHNKRTLPWRATTLVVDPYSVWLSEIMLQQTTVGAVKPYFEKFTKRWETVQDLADATHDDVMHYWAGLGYYARARNLHQCAKVVANEMQGIFPQSEKELLALPGVGVYTAAAICAIAFGTKAVVVDANVQRVVSRLYRITESLPASNPIIYKKTASITPDANSGNFAQAFMDLGSSICTPRNPSCDTCPIEKYCKGKNIAETLPKKPPKKIKPIRKCFMYVIINKSGKVLAYKRSDKGLLGGTFGIPTTDWVEAYPESHSRAPSNLNWQQLNEKSDIDTPIILRHTFTHFHLDMCVFTGTLATAPTGYKWVDIDVLPTVFKKPVMTAIKG